LRLNINGHLCLASVICRWRSDHREQLSQFFSFWTLKESFIKAIGIGLGLDLNVVQPLYLPSSFSPSFLSPAAAVFELVKHFAVSANELLSSKPRQDGGIRRNEA